MTDKEIIAQQKQVADEILDGLMVADPHCILAGGAPRNWWLGKPANDLDFYVHWQHANQDVEIGRFKRMGFDVTRLEQSNEEHYQTMPSLGRVWECEYKGIKVQFMVMREPTFKTVIPSMGTSVCKAWYKGGRIRYTLDFLVSHINNVMFLGEGYTGEEMHVKKMKEYFPDYRALKGDNLKSEVEKLARSWNCYPSQQGIMREAKGRGLLND